MVGRDVRFLSFCDEVTSTVHEFEALHKLEMHKVS